ncbi:MAG: NfeD family protein [Acidobacteriota bacterium]|nr:NfeD family protein [Acidobacteriota bacterium]
MTVLWWHWLALGLVLVVLELASPGGFFVLFFGLAAIAVGLLSVAGLDLPLWMELALFSVLSAVFLLLFRSPIMRRMQLDRGMDDVDSLKGEPAKALEDFGPGDTGRVELRGSTWSARNGADVLIARGARVRVIAVDRLTVVVIPEGAHA